MEKDLLSLLGYQYPSEEGADYQYYSFVVTNTNIIYTVVNWANNDILGTYSWKTPKDTYNPQTAIEMYHRATKEMITDELARKVIIVECNNKWLDFGLPLIMATQNTEEWVDVVVCDEGTPLHALGYESMPHLDSFYSEQYEILENSRGYLRKMILNSIVARDYFDCGL